MEGACVGALEKGDLAEGECGESEEPYRRVNAHARRASNLEFRRESVSLDPLMVIVEA